MDIEKVFDAKESKSFNEAGAIKPRKCRGPHTSDEAYKMGFNEAGAIKPRKCRENVTGAPVMAELQ